MISWIFSSHELEGHRVGFYIVRVKGLVKSQELSFLVNQVNRFYSSQLLDQLLTSLYHFLIQQMVLTVRLGSGSELSTGQCISV